MSEFKVGDKVKCISPVDDLVKGRTYTVSFVVPDAPNPMVDVKESEYTGGFNAERFELVENTDVALEDTPMTETEKAIYHLQSLLATNNASICITAEGVEVFRHEEDESFSPTVGDVDELLKALDVIESYEN